MDYWDATFWLGNMKASGGAPEALESRPWELCELKIDHVESHDLAGANPEIFAKLTELYTTWIMQVGVSPNADKHDKIADDQGLFTLLVKAAHFWQAAAMELSREQFDRIKDCLPRQRGNVRVGNFVLLNALLYALEHGCKWRGLPKGFGKWHTLYTRLNRWSKKGVIERVFTRLQEEQILSIKIEVVSLDSTSIKVHPDGTGARKKTGRNPLARAVGVGTPRFLWCPRLIGAL